LRVNILRLDENPQTYTDNDITQYSDSPDTNPITNNAPGRTGHQSYKLVSKAQCPDGVANMMLLADSLSDHEADSAVQEDEE
jgi:hypothetical protein